MSQNSETSWISFKVFKMKLNNSLPGKGKMNGRIFKLSFPSLILKEM